MIMSKINPMQIGVGALGTRHGDRLAPQVLDRLHVLCVLQ